MIAEYLKQILSARYGKDVRQAIHDSINELDGVARTAQNSATSASQIAIAQASQAVNASQIATQKAEEAKTYAENASAVTGVEIATKDRAGLVKGGDNYISEDGTLTLTMETTDKTMYNSHGGGVYMKEIGGKTEQRTTTGAQLWSAETTVTVNRLNTYNVSLPVGTYTISCDNVESNDTDRDVCLVYDLTNKEPLVYLNREKGASGTFTLTKAVDKINLYASYDNKVSEGDTATFSNIMLNEGTEKKPWEPYTGKKQSPSPEYPQERKKVVLTGAKSVGKNLLDLSECKPINYEKVTISGDNIIIGADSILYGVRWGKPPLEVGKTYAFSYESVSQHTQNYGFRLAYEDGTYSGMFGASGKVVLVDKPIKQLIFYIGFGATFTTDTVISKPQVELDEKATDFDSYQEKSVILSKPITLNGINDAQDLIVRKDGVWDKNNKFAEADLGALTWYTLTSNGVQLFYSDDIKSVVYSPNYNAKNNLLCNVFTVTSASAVVNADDVIAINNEGRIYVHCSAYTDVTAFKTAMSGNVLCYELKTPTFEPLPTADQIALNSLLSFDGTTHLYFDSEIEPTSLLEYGTSHVGAMTLEAWNKAENNRIRTEELTNALLMMNQG